MLAILFCIALYAVSMNRIRGIELKVTPSKQLMQYKRMAVAAMVAFILYAVEAITQLLLLGYFGPL